jgi:hypothetical protein
VSIVGEIGRISLGSMLCLFESAHFRTQNRDDTFVENALVHAA